jgi:hypothetical protein
MNFITESKPDPLPPVIEGVIEIGDIVTNGWRTYKVLSIEQYTMFVEQLTGIFTGDQFSMLSENIQLIQKAENGSATTH